MFPACPSTLVRDRWGRLLGAAVVLALVGTTLVLPTPRAQADSVVAPISGSFTVRGSGWGHGFGMSQYGAYGAARSGRSWKQILAFYYPGTKVTTMPSGTVLKVWISRDSDGSLRVRPAAGLNVRDANGGRTPYPGERSTPPGGSAGRARATGSATARPAEQTSPSGRGCRPAPGRSTARPGSSRWCCRAGRSGPTGVRWRSSSGAAVDGR